MFSARRLYETIGYCGCFPTSLVQGVNRSCKTLDQGFLTGGKFPPWGKYWEFRGEMRAFENCHHIAILMYVGLGKGGNNSLVVAKVGKLE